MSSETEPKRRANDRRETILSRDAEGKPIGAMLFVTANELDTLGVNVSVANRLAVYVEDGQLCIEPV